MKRIVIVCGNKHKAAMLSEFARLLGHRVEVVSTAQQAMDRRDDPPPDVVLWDCESMEASALQAARRFRQSPHRANLLMLAAVNWTTAKHSERLLRSIFDDLLPNRLSAYALKEVLDRGYSHRAPVAGHPGRPQQERRPLARPAVHGPASQVGCPAV